MAKQLRLRRGTTTQHGSFTGAEGEVTVDLDKDVLVVHDNATAGGRPMLREDLNNMPASGVSAGTYGSATQVAAVTVDAKGRVTSASNNTIDVSSQVGSVLQGFDADTAKTDVAQTFTAGQRGELTTLTSSSGSVAIDFSASNNFSLTLSEAVTAVTVSNATAGQTGSIFIKQPASGGPYAVGGWVAAFLFSGGAAPTITQTASKCDRVDYTIRSATEIQVVWTGNY